MKKKHRFLKGVAITLVSVASLVLVCIGALYIYAKININYEADEILFEKARDFSPTVFYADESPEDMYSSYTPKQIWQSGTVRREYVSLDEISSNIKDGFLAVEDREFYSHSGVDIKRTALAAINYLVGSDNRFGASTITQQLVKNVSGDNELTVTRKLSEMLRAFHIEKRYSKDEIFELYLNVIPMGENMYGVGVAAEKYFAKTPSELTAAEAATLIGITNAPSAYNPYNNPDACLKKRNIVLKVMNNTGILSDAEYAEAVAQPLTVAPRESNANRYYSWFVECAIDDVSSDLAIKYSISDAAARILLLSGGYSVYTTVNEDVQTKMEEYFENPDNLPSEVNNGLNYAMVITDTMEGNIVGIIGRAGKKQGNRLLNHATVPHTPASTIKPLSIYAPLIDEGKINCATVIDDTPVAFYENGDEYTPYPHNSPNVYAGLTTVTDAVRLSKNTVALKLYSLRGAEKIYGELVGKFHFDTLVREQKTKGAKTLTDLAPSPLAFGQLTNGISLRKLTEAYGSLGNDGILKTASTYMAVLDTKGGEVLANPQKEERVFKDTTSKIMTQLLKGVTEDGTAKSLTLKSFVDLAGKTGTSSNNRDKLFVGYTPYYTAGIWSGYDNGTSSVASLSKSHLKIWDEVMLAVHEDIIKSKSTLKSFSTEGLVYRPYCMDSGKLYSEACRYDVRTSRLGYGYFTPDNAPSEMCDRHVLCDYDAVSKGVCDPTCPEENRVKVALLNIPERSFKADISITDAEYVYREISENIPRPTLDTLPYFYYTLPVGEYVGKSGTGRQFNRSGKKY
ncbi:MAG: transglycosylase domain-containing protein [Clostridia bacterium]|nr:transglycosylase domain-containing protein [Clostridia bacterium]